MEPLCHRNWACGSAAKREWQKFTIRKSLNNLRPTWPTDRSQMRETGENYLQNILEKMQACWLTSAIFKLI